MTDSAHNTTNPATEVEESQKDEEHTGASGSAVRSSTKGTNGMETHTTETGEEGGGGGNTDDDIADEELPFPLPEKRLRRVHTEDSAAALLQRWALGCLCHLTLYEVNKLQFWYLRIKCARGRRTREVDYADYLKKLEENRQREALRQREIKRREYHSLHPELSHDAQMRAGLSMAGQMALKIQCWYRMLSGRWELERRRNAFIRKNVTITLDWVLASVNKISLHVASFRLQRFFRYHVTRRKAASQIQRIYRGRRTRRLVRRKKKQQRRKRAAEKIQKFYRIFVCQKNQQHRKEIEFGRTVARTIKNMCITSGKSFPIYVTCRGITKTRDNLDWIVVQYGMSLRSVRQAIKVQLEWMYGVFYQFTWEGRTIPWHKETEFEIQHTIPVLMLNPTKKPFYIPDTELGYYTITIKIEGSPQKLGLVKCAGFFMLTDARKVMNKEIDNIPHRWRFTINHKTLPPDDEVFTSAINYSRCWTIRSYDIPRDNTPARGVNTKFTRDYILNVFMEEFQDEDDCIGFIKVSDESTLTDCRALIKHWLDDAPTDYRFVVQESPVALHQESNVLATEVFPKVILREKYFRSNPLKKKAAAPKKKKKAGMYDQVAHMPTVVPEDEQVEDNDGQKFALKRDGTLSLKDPYKAYRYVGDATIEKCLGRPLKEEKVETLAVRIGGDDLLPAKLARMIQRKQFAGNNLVALAKAYWRVKKGEFEITNKPAVYLKRVIDEAKAESSEQLQRQRRRKLRQFVFMAERLKYRQLKDQEMSRLKAVEGKFSKKGRWDPNWKREQLSSDQDGYMKNKRRRQGGFTVDSVIKELEPPKVPKTAKEIAMEKEAIARAVANGEVSPIKRKTASEGCKFEIDNTKPPWVYQLGQTATSPLPSIPIPKAKRDPYAVNK